MTFGLSKCKSVHNEKEKLKQTEDIFPGITNKYLRIEQARGIIQKRKLILNTGLNSKYMTRAINTYAISVLNYSFEIISSTHTDVEELQRVIRTTTTKMSIRHSKSATERTEIPRRDGGREILSLEIFI